MKHSTGTIIEIRQTGPHDRHAVIAWPAGKPPLPGQYLQAYRPEDVDLPTAITIYPGGLPDSNIPPKTFSTAPPIPSDWGPGDQLILRGPLGNGFTLPPNTHRLALISLGETSAHLLPLAGEVLAQGGEVALFTAGRFPRLPARIEVSPLESAPDALPWADFIALSGSPDSLQHTKNSLLGISPFPCPAQALILIDMPCGALADCGVCAIKGRDNKYRLACADGPVFDWREL